MSEKIIVFDTTLRDGEQAAGVCFSERDKVEIASHLEAMGVDVIEAGFPAASRAEACNVAAVARQTRAYEDASRSAESAEYLNFLGEWPMEWRHASRGMNVDECLGSRGLPRSRPRHHL